MNKNVKVIIVGKDGQLGKALQHIMNDYSDIHLYFFDKTELDITKPESMEPIWKEIVPDFCINTAAYTAVDRAEVNSDEAHLINVTGVKNLIDTCQQYKTTLLHISTDYVFDGEKTTPYLETDIPNPINVYGMSKYKAEVLINNSLHKYFIIRTSWLYSQFGSNFVKTMLGFSPTKESVHVLNDQIGSPTHAIDLAKKLIEIIQSGSKNYGIYHFTNEGSTTWYGFAKKIFEIIGSDMEVDPLTKSDYSPPAKRPDYSVLDKTKIKNEFGGTIRDWEEVLEEHLKKEKQ